MNERESRGGRQRFKGARQVENGAEGEAERKGTSSSPEMGRIYF